MRKGLYGKLPSKRDFIAHLGAARLPARLGSLDAGGVSASTLRLGTAGGRPFCGRRSGASGSARRSAARPMLGRLHAVARRRRALFPLDAVRSGDRRARFPPPEFEPQTAWFDGGREAPAVDARRRHEPRSRHGRAGRHRRAERPRAALRQAATHSAAGRLGADRGRTEASFTDVFTSARMADHAAAYAASTFWWTAGGEGFPAMALAQAAACRTPSSSPEC